MANYSANLIPAMTSNTAPSGVASASSIYASSNDAWKAFDGINVATNNGWVTPSGTPTGWLAYEFVSNTKINKYVIKNNPNYMNAMPKSWTFEGSNNGTSWTILDTQTNITGWVSNDSKEFIFNNNTAYKKYRINITANNGDVNVAIAELQMMSRLIQTMYLIQDKNNILYTGSGGGCSANLIPVMTSNTAPSGVASASSIVSSNYDAWKAFDGTNADTNDCWMTVSGTITGWLKYDFGSGNEKIIGQYMVSARNYATTSSPKTWTFEGSNDNVSWSVLDTRAGEAVWSQSERRTYTFINNNKYRYYRINVTESYGTTYLSIANLEMFEKIMLQLNNLNTTTLSDSLFINKGITDPTVINNKQLTQRGIYGTDKGTLGTGKYFEFSLDSTFKSVNNIK